MSLAHILIIFLECLLRKQKRLCKAWHGTVTSGEPMKVLVSPHSLLPSSEVIIQQHQSQGAWRPWLQVCEVTECLSLCDLNFKERGHLYSLYPKPKIK